MTNLLRKSPCLCHYVYIGIRRQIGDLIKALFVRETGAGYKLLAWFTASCILITADAKTSVFDSVRSALGSVVGPLHFVTESPYRAAQGIKDAFAARASLLGRNAELERELVEMQGKVLRYEDVLNENSRLRELFGSRTRLRDDVAIAEVLAVSAAPLEIVIDKGQVSGVALGQAVVDSTGLLGQIVETSAFTSRVLLITDRSHAVPVRVLRNDVRAIAAGTGVDRLTLKDVALTLDIREGDRLVSSGLAGRFPNGYPVGTVESVLRDQTESSANIVVLPSAALDRARQVLVVLPGVADADLPNIASETAAPAELAAAPAELGPQEAEDEAPLEGEP